MIRRSLALVCAAFLAGVAGHALAQSDAAGAKTEVKADSNATNADAKETNADAKVAKADTKKATSKEKSVNGAGTMPVKPAIAPAHVTVQHILIGFAGSVPGKGITRTQAQAKELAYQILERARKGENFDELVKKYTDDSPPGIYKMSATGVNHAQDEFPREQMVPAFGNVGFNIIPGNIGIADYDPKASPFGWHIIKRLK